MNKVDKDTELGAGKQGAEVIGFVVVRFHGLGSLTTQRRAEPLDWATTLAGSQYGSHNKAFT